MPLQHTSQGSPKQILHSQGLVPKKHFGQNFLVNPAATAKLIAAAELARQDTVLEIGPGLGALTREIASRVKRVIAVERDRDLAKALAKELPGVVIVQQDILRFPLANLPHGYKVVANLPFAITGPVIRRLLEAAPPMGRPASPSQGGPPSLMVLLVQKEVAQRICARPPDMNLLAASVQFYAQPKLLGTIKKGSFWPPPNVDAGIIKIVPFETRPEIDPALFFRVLKAGFLHPRKQILNNLKEGLNLSRDKAEKLLITNGILPSQRAETLSLADWKRLALSLSLT